MGTAREVGLLIAPLTLVRAPVRVGLKVAEVSLATAAEAARIGMELLNPDRDTAQEVSEHRVPGEPEYVTANGTAPPMEPEAVTPDAPPAVPEELIPDHVDEDVVLVAEAAEEGAEQGAGPELTVEAPWEGYDRMTAADIRDRLALATAVEAAAVELYETTGKNRRTVIDAAARALRD